MAKIYVARIDHDALDGIEVAPPRRDGGWAWAVVFVVFLVSGAALGLSLATGSLSNALDVAQAGFATDGTGETATN
jgi:hypothetical protein